MFCFNIKSTQITRAFPILTPQTIMVGEADKCTQCFNFLIVHAQICQLLNDILTPPSSVFYESVSFLKPYCWVESARTHVSRLTPERTHQNMSFRVSWPEG